MDKESIEIRGNMDYGKQENPNIGLWRRSTDKEKCEFLHFLKREFGIERLILMLTHMPDSECPENIKIGGVK